MYQLKSAIRFYYTDKIWKLNIYILPILFDLKEHFPNVHEIYISIQTVVDFLYARLKNAMYYENTCDWQSGNQMCLLCKWQFLTDRDESWSQCWKA